MNLVLWEIFAWSGESLAIKSMQPHAVLVGSHLLNAMNIVKILVVTMNIFHYVEVLVTAALIRRLRPKG